MVAPTAGESSYKLEAENTSDVVLAAEELNKSKYVFRRCLQRNHRLHRQHWIDAFPASLPPVCSAALGMPGKAESISCCFPILMVRHSTTGALF